MDKNLKSKKPEFQTLISVIAQLRKEHLKDNNDSEVIVKDSGNPIETQARGKTNEIHVRHRGIAANNGKVVITGFKVGYYLDGYLAADLSQVAAWEVHFGKKCRFKGDAKSITLELKGGARGCDDDDWATKSAGSLKKARVRTFDDDGNVLLDVRSHLDPTKGFSIELT
jgi:hypothetical protein